MNPLNQQLVEKLHAADGQFCIAVTGGGSSAISTLFSVAGASATVLEAIVPYDLRSLQSYVASSRPLSCNSATARAMAMTAYLRAREYTDSRPVFGLGCTAALRTNRDRRGDDRCHVAVQSADTTWVFDLKLEKNQERPIQERNCADLILESIGKALGVCDVSIPGVDSSLAEAPGAWQSLLAGEIRTTDDRQFSGVFPGAFNPIHDGHRGMLEIAEKYLGRNIVLELSIRNVDKPPLDFLTMQERLTDDYDMVFTTAPTFEEKSTIFPGATFIVGSDTISRIDDPKYYAQGHDQGVTARDAALETLARNNNRFLVFGRVEGDRFLDLSSSSLSPRLQSLCDEVPESEFRLDISSTSIRAGQ